MAGKTLTTILLNHLTLLSVLAHNSRQQSLVIDRLVDNLALEALSGQLVLSHTWIHISTCEEFDEAQVACKFCNQSCVWHHPRFAASHAMPCHAKPTKDLDAQQPVVLHKPVSPQPLS